MEQQMQAGGVKGPIREREAVRDVKGVAKPYFWFNVVAKNGQIIATSEIYKTKRSMRKGVLSLVNLLQMKIVNK